MAKIHITLVGGQPAPVYKGIIDEQPDKVVLVCSSSTKKQADTIANYIITNENKIATNTPGFTPPEFIYKIFDPVDNRKIVVEIEHIDKEYITDKDEVSVNIAGGTKPWSILFYSHFSKKANVTCFYIDQNDWKYKYDFSNSERIKAKAPLDIDGTLDLHNVQVMNRVEYSFYDQSDFDAIEKIHEIRDYNKEQFRLLTAEYSKYREYCKKQEKKGYRPKVENVFYLKGNTCNNVFMRWNRGSKSFHFKLYNDIYGEDDFDVCSTNIDKLLENTGWFELEIAHLLRRWKPDARIRLNYVFSFKPRNPQDNPINEIDIIVEVGQKFLFVECKTGVRYEKITDVDKFNEAVKNYGGTASKPAFFTYEKNTSVEQKCENAHMFCFCLQDMQIYDIPEKSLFDELDEYMETYNIR